MDTTLQKTEEAIQQAESAIAAVVGKLIKTKAVAPADGDDVAQQLRMHVAAKAGMHEPGRSSLRTFIERIVENKVRDLLEHEAAQCRDKEKVTQSLDEPAVAEDGHECSLGDLIDVENAMRRAGMLPWAADPDMILDVRQIVQSFSEIDRLTCAALSVTKSLRQAAEELGVHVETVRERTAKIRAIFEAKGICGACPDTFTRLPVSR